MEPLLRQARVDDAAAISNVVQAGFNEFIAPDWEPRARQVFMEESSAERFAGLVPEAAFAAVAQVDGRIVGVILLTQPGVLAFLFVDASMHRRGIASKLWDAARAHLEAAHPTVKTVELNASPYAVAAYRALGFRPISAPFRRGGCLAVRMACWLPGRALDSAAPGKTMPFVEHLEARIDEARDGRSRLSLVVQRIHLNSGGMVHGGVLFTLADTGMGAALYSTLQDGERIATIEIKISFLRKVVDGEIACESEILSRGRSVASLESVLRVAGSVVAKASGSFVISARSGQLSEPPGTGGSAPPPPRLRRSRRPRA